MAQESEAWRETEEVEVDDEPVDEEDEEEQQEHVQDAETAAATGPRARLPSALKVVSMLDDGAERTRSTRFRLQRHFACWWIRY